MSIGLLGLLDDVTALAKVAAASIDDVAGQAAKAGLKAAGAVIDDTAVTPNYVTGFAADRELPIVGRIAAGSVRNKLLILLPAALALSFFAPWAITPLLAIGGAYLCFEGAEKVFEAVFPHAAHAEVHEIEPANDPAKLEADRINGAIQTDFILSAEIMTIALGTLPEELPFWEKAAVLAVVGIGITVAVYGAVALIVKMDDFGLMLAKNNASGPFATTSRVVGRGLVQGMPYFLKALGLVGTAAMLWVGGGIVIHGFEQYGLGGLAHALHDAGAFVGKPAPFLNGFITWFIEALGAGLFGLALGLLTIPVMGRVISPGWQMAGRVLKGAER